MSSSKVSKLTKAAPKVKKTLDDLLCDGQVKTGKRLADEKKQAEQDRAIFEQAALEEERQRRYKAVKPSA